MMFPHSFLIARTLACVCMCAYSTHIRDIRAHRIQRRSGGGEEKRHSKKKQATVGKHWQIVCVASFTTILLSIIKFTTNSVLFNGWFFAMFFIFIRFYSYIVPAWYVDGRVCAFVITFCALRWWATWLKFMWIVHTVHTHTHTYTNNENQIECVVFFIHRMNDSTIKLATWPVQK